MNKEPETVLIEIWYTNAPKSYDDASTITLVEADKSDAYDIRGEPLRKVGIMPREREWHQGRYHSGMYGMYTTDEVREFMGLPVLRKKG